jgi:hypothetical protein
MTNTLKNRPTETASGLALAGTVTGLLATNGVPGEIAVAVGLVVGLGPFIVTRFVDAARR